LAIALVCVAALAGVASYVGRTTLSARVEFSPDRAATAIDSSLSAFVQAPRSRESLESETARLAAKYGVRVLLIDPAGGTAVSSWGGAPSDFTISPDGTVRFGMLVLRGGLPVGGASARWLLYVLPSADAIDALRPARGSILRSIWLSAALGCAVAAIVALILGSYIVRPIRDLTNAARAMSRGDTRARVKVRGNDDLARLAESFNSMAATIESTEQLRRQMITDVAHELRNPLTRIIVQLEAASDGHLPVAEAMAGVREEAQRLESVVNDLRDLSLADAHELRVAKESLSLAECIDAAVERMTVTAKGNGVTLARDVPSDLPAAIGDRMRVAQILDNLISNALQHTPAGGNVVVGARVNHRFAECFVQDDGDGIASDRVPYVFERFYRADPSRSRATGGSGLGLAIVKTLVEAQGGTIGVTSVEGRGSRFTWLVPLDSSWMAM